MRRAAHLAVRTGPAVVAIAAAMLSFAASGTLGAQRDSVTRSPTGRRSATLARLFDADSGVSDTRVIRDLRQLRIHDVKVARNGRVYVLDVVAGAVKVFDESARFLFKFGSLGNGVGQFRSPNELELNDSTVIVREGVGRTVTFTVDGKHVSTHSPAIGAAPLERTIPMRGGTTLITGSTIVERASRSAAAPSPAYRSIALQRPQKTPQPLFRIRTDTVFLKRDSASHGDDAVFMPVLSRFGAGGAWAVSGDSLIAHVDGYSGEVSWYSVGADGAHIVRTGRLGRSGPPVQPDEVTDEATRIAQSVNSMMLRSRVAGAALPSRAPKLYATPAAWSIATRAFFSQEGDLWIGVNRITIVINEHNDQAMVGEVNTWTVFPQSGASYTVDLRPLFRLTAVRGDKLYGFEFGDRGAASAAVYILHPPERP